MGVPLPEVAEGPRGTTTGPAVVLLPCTAAEHRKPPNIACTPRDCMYAEGLGRAVRSEEWQAVQSSREPGGLTF